MRSESSAANYANDDYLVSPNKIAIQDGAYIAFWVYCDDSLYANEYVNVGIAVSSTSNTDPNAFTFISGWYIYNPYYGGAKKDGRGIQTSDNWLCCTMDLSAYAGQEVWVAINHYNSTRNKSLSVDDITIAASSVSNTGNITYQWEPGGFGQDITVSPVTTTTYIVNAYANSLCIGTAEQTIVVRPQMNVSITTDPEVTTVCDGEEITLTANVNIAPAVFYSPGDILCTDGTVVKAADWPCGKTAKGVVFYVDRSGQHGWAVAIHSSNDNIRWSSLTYSGYDIPDLISYGQWLEAIKDMDGYMNTMKIRNYSTNSSTPALSYPAAYSVDFDNGEYIPAAGQLNILFGELLIVNASLSLPGVGGTPLSTYNDLWSSTESSYTQSSYRCAMHLELNYSSESFVGRIGYATKTSYKSVRAVINF